MKIKLKKIRIYAFTLLAVLASAQELCAADMPGESTETPVVADAVEGGGVQLEEFSRKIEQRTFVPKGQWVAGLSVSFSQSNQNNYSFLIVEGIDGDTYSFKATPMLCYMVKDDMGLGGKLEYSRNRIRLDNADIVLDSETDYSNENLYIARLLGNGNFP